MKRALKTTLLTLSLLLAATSLILLPLSHRHRLFLGWQRLEQGTYPDNHALELFVTDGSLALEFWARDTFWLSTYQLTPPDWWDRRGLYAGAEAARPPSFSSPPCAFDRFGFHLHHEGNPMDSRRVIAQHTIIAIPLWLVILLSATPPAVAFVHRHRTRRRARAHLCPSCHYDLRATPARCPECGRNFPTPPPTTPSP